MLLLQGPFTIWSEKETCHIMLRHLLLGFEQELYQSNEFLSIYWCVLLREMSSVHEHGSAGTVTIS